MSASVRLETVHRRTLAAVRCELAPGAVGAAWKPALDKVWDFLHRTPGLWVGGHNVFIYHHPSGADAPLVCDFGVEVTRAFEPVGDVHPAETPTGEAAVAVHRGPYGRMPDAYKAIDEWMAANARESAGLSWEIYQDPTPDPAATETTVLHLLK